MLYGLPPTVLGEVILKRVEWHEFGFPAQKAQGVFKGWDLPDGEREELEKAEVWIDLIKKGRDGKQHLMTVFWEELLGEDLETVREELGVVGYEGWKGCDGGGMK